MPHSKFVILVNNVYCLERWGSLVGDLDISVPIRYSPQIMVNFRGRTAAPLRRGTWRLRSADQNVKISSVPSRKPAVIIRAGTMSNRRYAT